METSSQNFIKVEELIDPTTPESIASIKAQFYYKKNLLNRAYHSLTHSNDIYEKLVQYLEPPLQVGFFNDIFQSKYKTIEEVKHFMQSDELNFLKIYLGHEALNLIFNYDKVIKHYSQLESVPLVQENLERSIKSFTTRNDLSTEVVVTKLKQFGFKSIQVSHYMEEEYVNSFLNCLYEELNIFNKLVKLDNSLCNFNLVLCNKSLAGESCFDVKNNVMYIQDHSYGTFIHEWFHYFDYRSGKGKYSSFQLLEELKQFPDLINASQKEDTKHDTHYWTAPHELWARSFEAWISTKLLPTQIILGNHLKNNSVYPQGGELAKLGKWFETHWAGLKNNYLSNSHYENHLPKDKKELKYN